MAMVSILHRSRSSVICKVSKRTWRQRRFRKKDLTGADFTNAELVGATFDSCILNDATFHGANLESAEFKNCVAARTDFSSAVLGGAVITTNPCNTWFCCNFSDAVMDHINLQDAAILCSSFRGGRLKWANVGEDRVQERFMYSTFFLVDNIPREVQAAQLELPRGEFVAWKKGHNNTLIKVLVPANTQRAAGLSNKLRVGWVETLQVLTKHNRNAVRARSLRDPECEYRVGQVTKAIGWNSDTWNPFGAGIHLFMNKTEALNFKMW